ncbi:hypothetical protein [Arenimonas daejeonensis]|uniref:hypothetical protein n=1 Tax=Arenimonas daejeonensis TaxID=370777 RepID=UPI0013153EE0|nr:hypothetical protein [Arenimonas daejeonensis]
MSLLAELRRRNVIRMAGLYLVGAWLIVQVAETVLPAFDVPGWVLRALIIVLALGFAPAIVFAWIFELTPEGLRRDGKVAPEDSIAPVTGRRMDRMMVVGLVAVIAVMAIERFWHVPAAPAVADVSAAAAAARLRLRHPPYRTSRSPCCRSRTSARTRTTPTSPPASRTRS